MRTLINKLVKNERGAAAVEYVMIAGLIGLAIVLGATALGGSLNSALSTIGASVVTHA
jgi:pilus assembly protein Flp/PilA